MTSAAQSATPCAADELPADWLSLPLTRQQARESQSLFYFTRQLCKHGHLARRRTSNGACTVCHAMQPKRPRTDEQKAQRREQEQNAKVFGKKTCAHCGRTYFPKFQHATTRWEQSLYCSPDCKTKAHNHDPEHKKRKNAARRGNSELHQREYRQRIELHGSTRHHRATPEQREASREYNRDRFDRLYGSDPVFTAERKANAGHQKDRRKRAVAIAQLTPEQQQACKAIRQHATQLSAQLGIKIHVDHIQPLRRGGLEHPDNLQIITAEANLFWGDRIKRCPWPKPATWTEPPWEVPMPATQLVASAGS